MRWPWTASGGRVVVLVYHRVFEPPQDPQLLCVHPARFAEHLEHLRTFTVLRLRELDFAHLPERGVVVTFDDGYLDNLQFAKPSLQKYGVPATVFAATGSTGTDREFWWDELERIAPPSRYEQLHRQIRQSTASQREAILAPLRHGEHRADYRPMRPVELKQLIDDGLVDIGSHGVTHTAFTALTTDEQQREIVDSKCALETWLGRRVDTFAYPFGGKRDVPPSAIAAVRSADYHLACANFRKPVTAKTNPFLVPRFVVRNWPVEEFARQLQGFFNG